MKYKSFEELPVWRDAIELAARVFELTASEGVRFPSGFRDQLERAVVSISNNIAEGFERGTNQELIAFLYIARGSTGEVRSMLHLLARLGSSSRSSSSPSRPRAAPESGIPESGIADLKARSLSISRQLGAWIESLKNSNFKGTRHRNDAAREADDRARRRDEMLATLERYRDPALNQSPFRRGADAGPERDPPT